MKIGTLAPSSTCYSPPCTAAVRDSGDPNSYRSCIRTSVGCSWCVVSTCLFPRPCQPAAVAAAYPGSPALNHRSRGRCGGRRERLSSVRGTSSDVVRHIGESGSARRRTGTQVRPRRPPLTTHSLPDEPQPRQAPEKTRHATECPVYDSWAVRAWWRCPRMPPPATSPTAVTTVAPLLTPPRQHRRTAQPQARTPARRPARSHTSVLAHVPRQLVHAAAGLVPALLAAPYLCSRPVIRSDRSSACTAACPPARLPCCPPTRAAACACTCHAPTHQHAAASPLCYRPRCSSPSRLFIV